MKVLHVPYGFYPDPSGGTEAYVAALCRGLLARGVQGVVAAPADRNRAYEYEGLPVRRFATGQTASDLRELYGEGNEIAARNFATLLEEERPDVVHLHALTSAVSLRIAREVKRRSLPLVFTYHTPTVSCSRGTLMHWGARACDGTIKVSRCTACALHGHGLNKPASVMLACVPIRAGRLLGWAGLHGGAWTALRMTELVSLRRATFFAFMALVDRVIALSDWTMDVLVRNGVAKEKIERSHHGLVQRVPDLVDPPPPPEVPPLRIAFVGRMDPVKGADVLVRAVQQIEAGLVRLDIYGLAQGTAGEAYRAELRTLAGCTPAISFENVIGSDRIISMLRTYHMLAVPSRTFETGPLVILEAFAAGLPVLGSNLGGIADRVRHDVDGLLIEPGSVSAWRDTLSLLARRPELLRRLRAGVRPPRTMEEAAEQMYSLYERVLEAVCTR